MTAQDPQPQVQQQADAQSNNDEKREAKKKKRARRSSAFKRFRTIVLVVAALLAASHVMNNFDSVVGRTLVTVREKYVHNGDKGYAIVGIDGSYYWLSKDDWDSCSVGDEVKVHTDSNGSSFIEREGNLLREMFK